MHVLKRYKNALVLEHSGREFRLRFLNNGDVELWDRLDERRLRMLLERSTCMHDDVLRIMLGRPVPFMFIAKNSERLIDVTHCGGANG